MTTLAPCSARTRGRARGPPPSTPPAPRVVPSVSAPSPTHPPHRPRNLVDETLRTIAEQTGVDLASLPPDLPRQVRDLWQLRFRDTLEWRVGERLTAPLTDAQRASIAGVLARGDDAAEWLERHAPEHRRIVHDEMDVLVIEIASWFARISAPVAAR